MRQGERLPPGRQCRADGAGTGRQFTHRAGWRTAALPPDPGQTVWGKGANLPMDRAENCRSDAGSGLMGQEKGADSHTGRSGKLPLCRRFGADGVEQGSQFTHGQGGKLPLCRRPGTGSAWGPGIFMPGRWYHSAGASCYNSGKAPGRGPAGGRPERRNRQWRLKAA